jgi:hypothetical protein
MRLLHRSPLLHGPRARLFLGSDLFLLAGLDKGDESLLQLYRQPLAHVLLEPGSVDGVDGLVEGGLRLNDLAQLQEALAFADVELVGRGVAGLDSKLNILYSRLPD